MPFGIVGREMIAHFYSRNMARRNGNLEAVYALKNLPAQTGNHGEYRDGIGVLDVERGVVDGIQPTPWQTDTCVGGWYYDTRRVYKTPTEIIHMLLDIVSKNGNLLLNFPPRPDGTLDEQEEWICNEIGRWLAVNGEAIYGTRPWHSFGEGATLLASGAFAEREAKTFTAQDFRFTTSGDTIYAAALAWPSQCELPVKSLADRPVQSVSLVGHDGPLEWTQNRDGLRVSLPEKRPCEYAFLLKVF